MEKGKLEKRTIALIGLLLLVYYALPIGMYVYDFKRGFDVTDTGLGLYLAIILIGIVLAVKNNRRDSHGEL